VELADVLADQGQADEALQLTKISRAGAAPDDVAAQLVWRRARARVLAPRGFVQPRTRSGMTQRQGDPGRIFPNPEALLRLAGAVLVQAHGGQWQSRVSLRYRR
jgi:hypothetical protein